MINWKIIYNTLFEEPLQTHKRKTMNLIGSWDKRHEQAFLRRNTNGF